MISPEAYSESDTRHLGVLIGDPAAKRIIAVSTSNVFDDQSLLKTFWNLDKASLDNGFQGHMYTRRNDIIVVQVPYCNTSVPEMVTTSIQTNCIIWKTLTGIELSSPGSHIVLAVPGPITLKHGAPENITWYKGSITDAALARHNEGGEALLAAVFNKVFAEKLRQITTAGTMLSTKAGNTSFLMDKNNAMHVLQENNSRCAKTYMFNEDTDAGILMNKIPASVSYVFKPAGGAAGIGVYGNTDNGASPDQIRAHITQLRQNNQLPARFQVQEFVAGTPQGLTAYMDEDGNFEIFEIHQQFINNMGRFTGGRWTYKNQADQLENAIVIYKQLAAIPNHLFQGLICLDVIDGRVIEINPRVTASTPFTHLLRYQAHLEKSIGNNFTIQQMDINTGVPIPYEFFRSGKLRKLVEHSWEKHKLMVLPQGLNPFGNSRLVFINDNEQGSGQQRFIESIH